MFMIALKNFTKLISLLSQQLHASSGEFFSDWKLSVRIPLPLLLASATILCNQQLLKKAMVVLGQECNGFTVLIRLC